MKRLTRYLLWFASALLLMVCLLVGGLLLVLNTEGGTRWGLTRAQPLLAGLGVDLSWREIEGAVLKRLRISDLHVELAGAEGGSTAVEVARLEFDWQPWRLLSERRVLVDRLFLNGLTVALVSAEQEPPPPEESEPMTPEDLRQLLSTLPVAVDLRALELRDFTLETDGATSFGFDLLAAAFALDTDGLALENLQWRMDETQVDAGLSLETASLALAGNVDWSTRVTEQDYSGNLTLGGSLERIELEHAVATPLVLNSSGWVVPGLFAGAPLALDLRHAFNMIDLAPFGQEGGALRDGDLVTAGTLEGLAITGGLNAEMPGYAPIDLDLALEYSTDNLRIDSVAVQSSQLDFAANGNLELAPLALNLDWNLADFSPGDSLPPLRLENTRGEGHVRLDFGDDGLDADVALQRLSGELDGYPLSIDGTARLEDGQLVDLALNADTSNNRLTLSGAAQPLLDLRWDLQAPALTQLWDGLSGSLTGEGVISGSIEAPEVNGSLNASELAYVSEGTELLLRSLTLQAEYRNGGNDIQLDVGELLLGEELQLHQAQLRVSGTPEQHTLTSDIQAVPATLRLELTGGQVEQGWQGTLQSAEVESDYGDWALDSAASLSFLDGFLNSENQCWSYLITRVCVEAAQHDGGLDAALSLSDLPLDWLNPAASTPGKPAALDALQESMSFTLPANLRTEGRLQLEASIQGLQDGGWQSLDATLVPEDVVLQVTELLAEEEKIAQEEQAAEADAQTPEPAPIQRFVFHDSRVQASSEGQQWQGTVALEVSREGQDALVYQGGLHADVSMAETGELGGTVNFDFSDFSLVEGLVPLVSEPRGALNGALQVGGTREAPEVTGLVALRDGGVMVPEYGLAISDIEFSVRNESMDEVLLSASAVSGEGSIVLEGNVQSPLLDSRSASASFTGENFLALAADFAELELSPDLALSYSAAEMSVTGSVTVPRLDVDLSNLVGDLGGGSAVGVSPDVVVVRTPDGSEVGGTAGIMEGGLPIRADVTLILGDEVQLQGYGLDARLDGELRLEQSPNRPLRAFGELGIPEGQYAMYGQELNTRNGRVLFFGNPANPVIDMRAYRETASAEVGMQLSGPVANMQGELYSTPTLPESEILALLITGKSFSDTNEADSDAMVSAIANFGFGRSSGLTNAVGSKLGLDSMGVETGSSYQDSALGMGKYITPDLLMRYKVGLFDNKAVLSLDYSLTERLKLGVESGDSQSVDLNYTLERD